MRLCILLLLYSGWALSQSISQGTWSADNDNPPGLKEARANNYEKNYKPPSTHPPAYYTADYYEYQIDRNVTFTSQKENSAPEEFMPKEQKADADEEKASSSKAFAGGGVVQGRRITSKNCTYTCSQKLPKPKTKSITRSKSKGNGTSNLNLLKSLYGTITGKLPSASRKHKRSPASTYSYKRHSPVLKSRKYTAPVIIRTKHKKKPSISKTLEGSNLR